MPKATMIGFYRRCMAKIYNGVEFKKSILFMQS